jgi:hypothetical protein
MVMGLSVLVFDQTTTLEDIHGDHSVWLWVGATDLMIAILSALPALQFRKAATFPIVWRQAG